MTTKRRTPARPTKPQAEAAKTNAAKLSAASTAGTWPYTADKPPPVPPLPELDVHAPASLLVAAATIDKVLEMAREKPFADQAAVERVLRISFETIAKHDKDAFKLPPWWQKALTVGGLASIAAYGFYLLSRNKGKE